MPTSGAATDVLSPTWTSFVARRCSAARIVCRRSSSVISYRQPRPHPRRPCHAPARRRRPLPRRRRRPRRPPADLPLAGGRMVRRRGRLLRLLDRDRQADRLLGRGRAGHQPGVDAGRRERVELDGGAGRRNEGRVSPRCHHPPRRPLPRLGALRRSPQEVGAVHRLRVGKATRPPVRPGWASGRSCRKTTNTSSIGAFPSAGGSFDCDLAAGPARAAGRGQGGRGVAAGGRRAAHRRPRLHAGRPREAAVRLPGVVRAASARRGGLARFGEAPFRRRRLGPAPARRPRLLDVDADRRRPEMVGGPHAGRARPRRPLLAVLAAFRHPQ